MSHLRAAYGHALFFLFFSFFVFLFRCPVLEVRLVVESYGRSTNVVLVLLQRREGAVEGGEEDHSDHRFRAAPGNLHHLRRQKVRLQDRLRRQGLGRLDILPAY